MKFYYLAVALFSVLLFFGCSEEEDNISPNPSDQNLEILNFTFLAAKNASISSDIIGEISEDKKEIYVSVPFDTPVISLKPTISITDGAEIIPGNNTAQDFSEPIDYVISKNGFNKVTYTVIVTLDEEDEDEDEDEDESGASILSFSFLKENNPGLLNNYEAIIENNEIKLQLSELEELENITPTIEISEGASISPTTNTGIDFRYTILFTVTSENGETQKEYTVNIVRLRAVKDVVKFEVNINGNNFEATIDEDTNEIILKVPEGTDISNLTPEIQLSDEAVVSPLSGTPQNFSNPVTYTVTAEDGSEKEYTVYVVFLTSLELDRFFLEEFYRANERYNTPFTYLDWDLEAQTMENWNGVRIVDGRVSELVIASVRINEIPASIKYLNKLRVLTIAGRTLASIPAEIGSLETLELLILDDNRLTTIPKEIGNLPSIRGIYLKNNLLEELPSEIGNLPDSFYVLNIKGNNLRELPVEISNIPNLISLDIQNNPLTIIPQAICDMTTSNGVGIAIVKDSEDECM